MFLVNTARTFTLDVGSASAGTITITITQADGTEIVTDDATTDNSDGTYSYTLAVGLNDQLTTLRLDWEVATGEVFTVYDEVVGNLLYTVEQARSKTITGQQTPLSSASSYSDADIARTRQEITEQFEEITGRSWIRRHCRGEATGTGSRVLDLSDTHPRNFDGGVLSRPGRHRHVAEVIAASVNGTALDLADLQIHGSQLLLTSGTWSRGTTSDPFNVEVEWAYGPDPVPPEARENGLRETIKHLVPSDVPVYAQNFTGGDTTTTYPTGGFVFTPRTHQWLKRHKPVLIA